MRQLDDISIVVKGETSVVQVEEFLPYEPAAYVNDAGWVCFGADETEYFISQDGTVWKQPENEVVGVAPLLREQANAMERELDRAHGESA